MNALVLGVVLAAGSGLEASGAVTAGVDLFGWEPGGTASGLLHGRVEVRRDFGRAWASARASLQVTPTSLTPLTDLGSSVVVGARVGTWVEAVSVEVTPFFVPMSRRASFDWQGNWLTDAPLVLTLRPTIAADLKTRLGTAWLATTFKAERAAEEKPTLQPDVFLGLDVPLPAELRVELRAAWVRRGVNPGLSGALTLPRFALGGAARVSWTWNEPVGPMLDFFTYERDPGRFERLFELERRRAPRAAQLFLEGGLVSEQLVSALVFAAPTMQRGGWADLQGRLRLGDVRLFATARVQSAEHLVLAAGVLPDEGRAFPGESAPALEARLGVDGTLGRTGLTPGLLVSVRRPAFLVSDQGHFVLGEGKLAPGVAVTSVPTARASLRWDVASFAALVGELSVTLAEAGPRFGGHVAAQARF